MVIFIEIFTIESVAFSLTTCFYAETLMTISKVKLRDKKSCDVCIESRATLKFSKSLNLKEQFIMKI